MDDLQFSSRIARSFDRPRIARLCKRAVGPNDYVLANLDETIRKRRLFIVFSKDGDLIGMSSFTPIFDKSGWLGMARTDPAWRGRGVAQFLQRSIAKFARKRGIRKLRFFVLSTNTSSLRAARKGGFERVAHATHVTCNLKRSRSPARSQFQRDPIVGRVSMNQMLRSNYVSKMSGFTRYGYAFVRANRRNLLHIENKRQLFSCGEASFILVKTEIDQGEFSLLTGKLRESLLKVLNLARRMNLRTVGGFVPYDYHTIEVCKALGFKQDSWGRHSILFEKRI